MEKYKDANEIRDSFKAVVKGLNLEKSVKKTRNDKNVKNIASSSRNLSCSELNKNIIDAESTRISLDLANQYANKIIKFLTKNLVRIMRLSENLNPRMLLTLTLEKKKWIRRILCI